MTTSDVLDRARAQVLQKIGRNVVNFQRMEAMLKFLASHSQVSGPLHKLEDIHRSNIREMRRRPMGLLAESFVRAVYSGHPVDDPGGTKIDGDFASLSFSVSSGEAYRRERKAALKDIVASRNKLIHRWLASLDLNSIESCDTLSEKLDEQRESMRGEFEILRSMVLLLRESLTEINNYLDSAEFESGCERAKNEA